MDLDCISSDFKLSVPKQIFRIIFKIFIRVANVIVLSPRFHCRPKAFFLDLLERWDVRELYIPKTADLPMQLCLGTFPHFVAIGFYFLSETLIYKSLHQSFFYSFITILPSERFYTPLQHDFSLYHHFVIKLTFIFEPTNVISQY